MPATSLVSRNVTVSGHRTSLRLEPMMWDALEEICAREDRTIHQVCTAVNERRHESTLTAAIRVFILAYFRAAATDEGHERAGHGAVDRLPAEPRFGIASSTSRQFRYRARRARALVS